MRDGAPSWLVTARPPLPVGKQCYGSGHIGRCGRLPSASPVRLTDGVDLGYWHCKGQEPFDKMRAAYPLRDASRRTTAELFPPVYARVEH